MKRIVKLLAVLLLSVSCATSTSTPPLQMSLNRMLDLAVTDSDSLLTLTLQRSGRKVLDRSPLTIRYNEEDVNWTITNHADVIHTNEIKMSTGEFSSLQIDYTENVYQLTANNVDLKAELHTRLYNGAMAYRFVIFGSGKYTIEEFSPFRMANNTGSYFMPNGEYEPLGPQTINQVSYDKGYTTPIIYQSAEYTLGIFEADLRDYPQLRLHRDGSSMVTFAGVVDCEESVKLPWRVVMIGDNMADLQNQKPIYQTLNPAATGDFSWVKPGISMWDWRVKGCTFDGFTYEMNNESLKRYIDFCAANNLDYLLIDDEWSVRTNPLEPIAELDIKDVIRYGDEKGVGLLLYYDMKYYKNGANEIPFETVAETFASWGAKGVKYGFLGSIGPKFTPRDKAARTEELVQIAAKNHLIIDFHDNPVPFGGLERTYPNYINREFCHAQLDRRTAFTPTQFVKTACVNLLSGMIDQTNGTFALNEMASRSKGPRNEYNSTVSSEVARFIITHTGHLSVLIDAPEAYAAKSDLFEIIANLADSWDESRYLEMEFDSHVSVARRSGHDWFVGTVVDDNYEGTHTLNLDFLEFGANYSATIYSDADDTDYKTNKEAYKITKTNVKGGDQLTTHVATGGGYSVHFTKQ